MADETASAEIGEYCKLRTYGSDCVNYSVGAVDRADCASDVDDAWACGGKSGYESWG